MRDFSNTAIRGCSSLKISLPPVTCSACTLTRTDTCFTLRGPRSPPPVALRFLLTFFAPRPNNMLYLPSIHSIPRPIPRCVIYAVSRAFRNARRLNRVAVLTCRRTRSRIALFIGIRTFPTIFSKCRTSADVARSSLYKSCILLLYRCTVIRISGVAFVCVCFVCKRAYDNIFFDKFLFYYYYSSLLLLFFHNVANIAATNPACCRSVSFYFTASSFGRSKSTKEEK